MNVRTYPRGADVRLSPHFHLRELECGCGRCGETLVDLDHVVRLEALREGLDGRAIEITSGYRCPAHNAAVGGHPTSEHMAGVATDIVVGGLPPEQVADRAEARFSGVGRYDTFTHVDSRDLGYRGGVASRWDRRTVSHA